MPLLRAGDLWQNGQLIAEPDYELGEFPDIQIDRATTHLVKAGLNLDDKGFLLPIAEHPWHMHCTQSYCVMLELTGNRRIMIPCVELIRFYFGSSSNLITKLFLPPLERKSLYTNAQFNKTNGRLSLQLADRISGASASDIARLHQDPIAWRAAAKIGTSLLEASNARQQIYPQTLFPFEGMTALVAAGKWLPFENQPRATFVVYSLRSCSHPFPFRSLCYELSKTDDRGAARRQQRSTGGNSAPRKAAPDATNQDLVERDASNRLTSKTKSIQRAPRFPDLTKKSVWKNKLITSSETAAQSYAGTAPSLQAASVGEPGSEQRIRSIDLAVLFKRDPSKQRPVPDFLIDVVAELKQLTEVDVELLTESEEDGWTIPLTVLVNEDGEIDSSLFIKIGENQLRERRVAVFSVAYETECVKIVAIESSPVHVKLYLPSNNDETDLLKTLDCAAADFISRPEPKTEDAAHLIRWVFELPEPV